MVPGYSDHVIDITSSPVFVSKQILPDMRLEAVKIHYYICNNTAI